MIDINELRRLLNSTDMIDGIDLHANLRSTISELLDRLEAAERERDSVAQQLVQAEIGKRKLDAECDALRAKIAERGRQEPVSWLFDGEAF